MIGSRSILLLPFSFGFPDILEANAENESLSALDFIAVN